MPDCESVDLWRRKFRLNLSSSWKHDVEITVTDLSLWKKILDGWGYRDAKGKWRNKAPGIKALLDEYERQKFDQQLEVGNQRNHETSALPKNGRERLSERGDSSLREMWSEAPSDYFRTRNLVR